MHVLPVPSVPKSTRRRVLLGLINWRNWVVLLENINGFLNSHGRIFIHINYCFLILISSSFVARTGSFSTLATWCHWSQITNAICMSTSYNLSTLLAHLRFLLPIFTVNNRLPECYYKAAGLKRINIQNEQFYSELNSNKYLSAQPFSTPVPLALNNYFIAYKDITDQRALCNPNRT